MNRYKDYGERDPSSDRRRLPEDFLHRVEQHCTMRVQLIGHFQPCMPDIYLHIDARMADSIEFRMVDGRL